MVGPRDIREIRTDSLEDMGVPAPTDEVLIRDVTDGVVKIANVSDVGITDHGGLSGLLDDDHTQYLNSTRHDSEDHSTAMGTVVIGDISDVTIAAPASPDFLAWNGSAWVNREIAASDVTSGTFANARISQASVTQHQAALSITESQISNLTHYTSTDFDTDFGLKSTTDLTEGTNLYYTDARVNADIDARVTKAFVDALNVDADTLDSLNSTQFLRSDASDSTSGTLTMNAGAVISDSVTTAYNGTGTLSWNSTTVDQLVVQNPENTDGNNFSSVYFYTAGNSGNATGRMVLTNGSGGNSEFRWLLRDSAHTDFTNEKMALDSDGTLFINGNRALTVADEGTGNGLDADTLDGEHATAFADAVHTHAASDVVSGAFANARISQSSVTQHQAALSITESQISNLDHLTLEEVQDNLGTLFIVGGTDITVVYDDVANTLTFNKDALVAADIPSLDTSKITTGTFADARIAQSNVTQHQAALSITESQISDLTHYTSTNFNTDFNAKTTTDLTEGTNLYYTTARANADIDARVTNAFVDALNVDADTLDTLNSTQFLRSDANDTTTGTLNINNTADVSLTAGTGALVVGSGTSTNIGIDNNEIQARNNTAAAELNLNILGGTISLGPNLNVDANQISSTTSIVLDSADGTDIVFQEGNETVGMYDTSIRAWRFWSDGVESMRIDASNLVGQNSMAVSGVSTITTTAQIFSSTYMEANNFLINGNNGKFRGDGDLAGLEIIRSGSTDVARLYANDYVDFRSEAGTNWGGARGGFSTSYGTGKTGLFVPGSQSIISWNSSSTSPGDYIGYNESLDDWDFFTNGATSNGEIWAGAFRTGSDQVLKSQQMTMKNDPKTPSDIRRALRDNVTPMSYVKQPAPGSKDMNKMPKVPHGRKISTGTAQQWQAAMGEDWEGVSERYGYLNLDMEAVDAALLQYCHDLSDALDEALARIEALESA